MNQSVCTLTFTLATPTFTGCADSQQSYEIYKRVENVHTLATAFNAKVSGIITVVAFLGSALFPVSYAIFGYPPPHLWTLPIEIQ